MSNSQNPLTPYKQLGNKLKKIRLASKVDLSDICSAIEIDEKMLRSIESGSTRPDEDILELLIRYLNISEREADNLWDLAGYEEINEIENPQENLMQKGLVMLVASLGDNKVNYSDSIDVSGDNNGVVIKFSQKNGQTKTTEISKIGLSYETAHQLITNLQKAFIQKQLSSGLTDLKKEEK